VTASGLEVPAPLRLLHLPTTDSTNRVAREAAQEGQPGGLVIVADRQTAGRGRQGRSWHGEPDASLLVSFMLRPDGPLSQAWVHSLVAGLAALGAARSAGARAWLKWPNDVLIGDRKVAGVLGEVWAPTGTLEAVILGIGLNLRSPEGGWPDPLRARATALDAHRANPDRRAALNALCREVLGWQRALRERGPDEVVRGVEAAMGPMVGRAVRVEGRGGETHEATVLGIGQNGALRVRQGDVERQLLAGDVHLVRP